MRAKNTDNKLKLSRFALISHTVFIITWIIFAYMGLNVDSQYQLNYYIVLLGFLIVGGLFNARMLIKNPDIFEPLTLITFIYIMFFSISPMLDIITKNTYFFGYEVSRGTIKATIIFIVAYIAFFIGYSNNKINKCENYNVESSLKKNTKKKVWLNTGLWSLGLISSVIYLMSFGQSIFYIFSFGFGGTVATNTLVGSSLAFLGMFSYAMVVPWMYLIIYAHSKTFKLLITFLTSSIYFVLGFRFIMLIMILAPIVYYYIKQKKRPSINKVIIVLFLLTLLIGLVGFARGDVRSGKEVSWSEFGVEQVWYGVESNFEIYKAFYRMVEVIPENHTYTFGRQFTYTFIFMIPRFIWPNKPDTPLREVLSAILGDYSVDAGTAFPNIGEYYSEFGVIGVVILMYLFGMLCKKSMYLYVSNNLTSNRLIAYSILLPSYFQLIIRGYTPTNFWMLAFFMIVILINWRIDGKRF